MTARETLSASTTGSRASTAPHDDSRSAAAPTRVGPAERIGVGIVGGGFMAEVHARAARAARAELVGLSSSAPDRAVVAAERIGVPLAFPTARDLVADPRVDVVHVCSPNATHLEFAIAALEAGKHVVCEKPLATTEADARVLADAAAASGRIATVPFVYRFHPMVREARARVASGATGRLLSLSAAYLQDWLLTRDDDNWRVDGALGGPSRAFADIGSHTVDLVEFVTGDRIVRLLAAKRTLHTERASTANVTTEDLVGMLLQTESGAVGTVLVSQVAPGRKNALSLELHGSDESLRFEQESPESLWIGRRTGSELLPRNPEELSEDAARLSVTPAGHPLGYQDAFNAFVADTYAAIGGSTPPGLPMFEDGVRAARITDAVLASHESSEWVEV